MGVPHQAGYILAERPVRDDAPALGVSCLTLFTLFEERHCICISDYLETNCTASESGKTRVHLDVVETSRLFGARLEETANQMQGDEHHCGPSGRIIAMGELICIHRHEEERTRLNDCRRETAVAERVH